MDNIYIVMGAVGESSGRREWPVAAFKSDEEARLHAENATKRAAEIIAAKPSNYSEARERYKKNEFDPGMLIDYSGTRYYYMVVELRQALKANA